MLQERQGYVFETQTDTEVIAKLAKYVYDTQTEDNENNSFEAVVKAVVKELQGAYALIFKSSLFPNEIIATRRGSPLLLGIKSKDTPVDEKVEVTFSPAPTRKGKANARKKNERPRENPERTQEEGRVSDVEARRCAGLECRVRTGSANIAGAVAAGSITPNNKPPSGPVEYFLASDASAVIEHTRRVVYLEDGDIVYIRKQGTRWIGRG